MQKHLFIIDPLEKLNRKIDTSLHLAQALSVLGAHIYFAECTDFVWNSLLSGPRVMARKAVFGNSLLSLDMREYEEIALKDFSGVYMRKEPPVDVLYQSVLWMLESVGSETMIFNSPSAILSFNEKVTTLLFPEESKPGLVSANRRCLLDYLHSECHGDSIVKPLDQFGGVGVERIQTGKNQAGLD